MVCNPRLAADVWYRAAKLFVIVPRSSRTVMRWHSRVENILHALAVLSRLIDTVSLGHNDPARAVVRTRIPTVRRFQLNGVIPWEFRKGRLP
jgi:hypothetical protein